MDSAFLERGGEPYIHIDRAEHKRIGFGVVQACFAHESQMDKLAAAAGLDPVTVRLRNPTARIAFFERAELLPAGPPERADEILPVTYDDNYVTVFPGETVEVRGRVLPGGPAPEWVRVTGHNSAPVVVPVR